MVSLFEQDRMKEPEMKPRVQPKTSKNAPQCVYMPLKNLNCTQVSCLWLQVDPNTGTAMYESDDIIKYLVQKYGVFLNIDLLS
jgi:hypothetical protein